MDNLLFEAGQDEAPGKAFTRSLDYFRYTEEKQQGVIFAKHKLALLKQKNGDLQSAKAGMVEVLESARQLNDLHVIAYGVDDAGKLIAQRIAEEKAFGPEGQEKLARIFGAVDHWREMLALRRM